MSGRVETATGVRRRYAAAVVARAVLRDVALACAERSIPVMPLKGAFFQLFLYADPAERVISDVDVLVPEPAFEAAIGTLLAAGFSPQKAGRSLVEVTLLSPRGFPVDLHRRLFSPGRYRLDTAGVFRRSVPDEALIGAPLALAHPLDTAAHLVGKFASDHVRAEAEPRLQELARVCEHYQLDAQDFAQHLSQHGLERAARHTLGQGKELPQAALFTRVLERLPVSPAGVVCCELARVTFAHCAEKSALASAGAHLLNGSLPRAAASLACMLGGRVCHAFWRRSHGRGAGMFEPFFAASSAEGQGGAGPA